MSAAIPIADTTHTIRTANFLDEQPLTAWFLVRRFGRNLNAAIALFPRVVYRQLGSRSRLRRSAAILRIGWVGNGRDEAIALLRDGFDVERLVGRITQGLAELHDRSIQTVVEIDEGVGRPEMLAQLLARDHLPGVLQQQEQNARRLFAQLDDRAIAAQFST